MKKLASIQRLRLSFLTFLFPSILSLFGPLSPPCSAHCAFCNHFVPTRAIYHSTTFMITFKLALISAALVTHAAGLSPGNYSLAPAASNAVESTTSLSLTTSTTTAEELPEPSNESPSHSNRLKNLAKESIDLDTWIEMYYRLYPQEKVQKAKKVVKQRYMSASKLVLKEGVKGLISKLPLKVNATFGVASTEDPHHFNSSSLLRKLLGKDLESDSDESDSDDSCSDAEQERDSCSGSGSDSDSDCEDYKYSWDDEYESWAKQNLTKEVSNKPEKIPEAEVKSPLFNFTNYTAPRFSGHTHMPPEVKYPSNHSNYTAAIHEETNAGSLTRPLYCVYLLYFIIHNFV